jgi:hypothetical protein
MTCCDASRGALIGRIVWFAPPVNPRSRSKTPRRPAGRLSPRDPNKPNRQEIWRFSQLCSLGHAVSSHIGQLLAPPGRAVCEVRGLLISFLRSLMVDQDHR